MNHIIIAPAKVYDVPAIGLLLTALYRELGLRARSRSVDPADITARIFDNSSTVLLACYNSHPIGILTFSSPRWHQADHDCAIDELYVLPSFRSLAVGELLLQQGIELAHQKGWNSLSTGLNDRCTSAICRTAAFVPTGIHRKNTQATPGLLFH
jgi:GNAT superfamily N-acetyltransferase